MLYATATPADKPTHIEYLERICIFEGKDKEQVLRNLNGLFDRMIAGGGRVGYSAHGNS